ncbi:methionyl-tRNA formyltransferase [Bradyrhizobium sp. USDA 4473]
MTRKLRIGVIGRTEMLFEAARRIHDAGHDIPIVATCRASGHELKKEADYERWAADIGARFLLGSRLDQPDTIAALQDARCDAAISMNWVGLIPPVVRAQFTHGIFNSHPGDLPRFKGNACPNWAILLGEERIGLTIHQMSDGLDAGPVAAKSFLPIDAETTIADVYDWLRLEVPVQFSNLIETVAQGNLSLAPQPTSPELGLRCYPRRASDGRIDWAQSAQTISRLVRASGRPFEGAFTMLEGDTKVLVWGARVEAHREPFVAVPGQVVHTAAGDPVIATGDGLLRLTDLELDGTVTTKSAKQFVLSSLRNRLI